MSELGRAQERIEKRRIGSGMRLSLFGLLLCWVPFLGALLASIGFVKSAGSITARHRAKRRAGMLLALIVLILALGLTTFEVYQYTHNPWMMEDLGSWIMNALTGEDLYTTGYDYSGSQGMGLYDGAYAQGYTADGYYAADGSFVPYAEPGEVIVGSDETGG